MGGGRRKRKYLAESEASADHFDMFISKDSLKEASRLLLCIQVVNPEDDEEVVRFSKNMNRWNEEDSLEELERILEDFKNILWLKLDQPDGIEID